MTLAEFLLARIAEDEEVATTWQRFEVRGIPARVLAECEAKRRIVEDHEWDETPGSPVVHSRELRHLAAVYADHSEFREEWKP